MKALSALVIAMCVWVAMTPHGEVPKTSSIRNTRWPTLGRDLALVCIVCLTLGIAAAIVAGIILRLVVPRLSISQPPPAMTTESATAIADYVAVGVTGGLTVVDSLRLLAAADAGQATQWASSVLRDHDYGMSVEEALAAHVQPVTVDICRVLSRAHATGAPVAQRLRRLATASRQRQQDELLRKVRGLSVRAVVPLGVCFLPAFLLLAVVPLVASLATGLAG